MNPLPSILNRPFQHAATLAVACLLGLAFPSTSQEPSEDKLPRLATYPVAIDEAGNTGKKYVVLDYKLRLHFMPAPSAQWTVEPSADHRTIQLRERSDRVLIELRRNPLDRDLTAIDDEERRAFFETVARRHSTSSLPEPRPAFVGGRRGMTFPLSGKEHVILVADRDGYLEIVLRGRESLDATRHLWNYLLNSVRIESVSRPTSG